LQKVCNNSNVQYCLSLKIQKDDSVKIVKN
jgi:hypothetical protein